MAEKMRKVRIEVTANDIAQGRRHNGLRCAIALAIKRELRLPTVGVGFSAVGVPDLNDPEELGCSLLLGYLPNAATKWLIAMDQEGSGSPFIFEMKVNEDLLP